MPDLREEAEITSLSGSIRLVKKSVWVILITYSRRNGTLEDIDSRNRWTGHLRINNSCLTRSLTTLPSVLVEDVAGNPPLNTDGNLTESSPRLKGNQPAAIPPHPRPHLQAMSAEPLAIEVIEVKNDDVREVAPWPQRTGGVSFWGTVVTMLNVFGRWKCCAALCFLSVWLALHSSSLGGRASHGIHSLDHGLFAGLSG